MNKYDVVKTIGEGAYGVVLQCKNKETNELVAIKRFKESDEDELVRKTTLREVRILRLLKDEPFVVRLQEAFRRKGKLYLVFDYVGCNLLDVLEQHPQGLPTEDIRRMVFSMLLGIRACHANGIIHRDIKPENLLIHEDNTLRLCDFGFARIYSTDMNDLTDYVATRWYRSPELLLGTTDYGLPSDIWAAGCIMAELIDGQAIFPCETEVDQIFVIQKLLGNFTPHQVEMFKKNPRFHGYTLKEIAKVDSSLERKFAKKASKKALALLKTMLVIDPSKRCSVDEALNHPFFEGLAEVYYPQLKNITPYIRPPSAGVNKIPGLARPPSSLAKQQQQRVSTPSEGTELHHHGHTGGEDAGGEHDGSAPLTGSGARVSSPWGSTTLPKAVGASSSTTLPPARVPSATGRQHGISNDPLLLGPRVSTPFGGGTQPVVQGMLTGNMGLGGGLAYGVPQAPLNTASQGLAGSFTGRNPSRFPLPSSQQPGSLPRLNFTAGFTGATALPPQPQPSAPSGTDPFAPTIGTSSYFTGHQQPQGMYGAQPPNANAYGVYSQGMTNNSQLNARPQLGQNMGSSGFSRPDLVNGGHLPPRAGGNFGATTANDPYKHQPPPPGASGAPNGYRPRMY